MLIATCAFSQGKFITESYAEYQRIAGSEPYLFTIDGERYILSYDTLKNKQDFDSKGYYLHPEWMNEVANRPVFIFRFNGIKWVKATNSPVQYDYHRWDSIGYSFFNDGSIKTERFYNIKCYWTAFEGNRVIQLKDGKIAILVTNYHEDFKALANGRDFKYDVNEYKTIEMVLLIPIGAKMYAPVVYNTLNAGKIPYDYASMLSQMKEFDINKDSFELVTNGETIKFKRAEQ